MYALTRVPALRNLVDARLLEVRMHHQDGSEQRTRSECNQPE
jgi:hypothetical protein